MKVTKSKVDVLKLVAFAILMENGDGIKGKSPEYILEKYEMANLLDEPQGLLDQANTAKFEAWIQLWLRRQHDPTA